MAAFFKKYSYIIVKLFLNQFAISLFGIGLAFAREVIASQDGTITAKNAEDGGAQFTLTFYKTVL